MKSSCFAEESSLSAWRAHGCHCHCHGCSGVVFEVEQVAELSYNLSSVMMVIV
jgi:hypothetical protein